MSAFWNNWATAHRNWNAIFMAVSLGGILIWALILNDAEFLRTDRVMATVTEVNVTGLGNLVKFELPNGKQTSFMMDQGTPKVGEQRPILIDIYDNGKNYSRYDKMDWNLNY